MNAGDLAILWMLVLCLIVLTIGTVVFGLLGLVLGARRMWKALW